MALTDQNYTSLAIPAEEITESREELIKEYFHASYTYAEIIEILFYHHGIKISLRQLNRKLHEAGLRRYSRRHNHELLEAIQREINGAGSNLGYRSMTKRLLSRHGIAAPRSVVSELQRVLDPEGVARRQSHQLKRRTYFNKGPNYLIHVDGYDKLKPYGFAIHGAICGYSRRILWLNVSNTNNDPAVIAYYFMQYVREIKAVPRCIRADAGTENVLIEDIQKAFRYEHADDMAGENSFLIGSSKSNQRIERWWLWNKQGGCQFWIDTFKDLVDSGILSTANPLHIECARFCFMDIIQRDLDAIKAEWNQHKVRHCSQPNAPPGGKPDLMYFVPTLYGTVDYKISVDIGDIENVTNSWCKKPLPMGCDDEVRSYFAWEMNQRALRNPLSVEDALEIFEQLIPIIDTN